MEFLITSNAMPRAALATNLPAISDHYRPAPEGIGDATAEKKQNRGNLIGADN